MSRQSDYQARHKKLGLCVQCSRKAVVYRNVKTGELKQGVSCSYHLRKRRIWKRVALGLNSQEDSGRGRRPIA